MRIRLWLMVIVPVLVFSAALLPWIRVSAGDFVLAPRWSGDKAPRKEPSPRSNVPTITVNSRRIRLNYNISDVGPSGVSSIELWATRDGRTWQRYSNEPPPAGPLVVHVAEEGRYGFTIVVRSGVGLSTPPPRTGDPPQLWVEVDETHPVVRLLQAEIGKGSEHGNLTLTWMASDANLLPRPITLSMAPDKAGPWTPLATNLENTGKYVWHLPKDVPYQFYVRVEAHDRAGNCGVDCCSEPIKVDHALPKGTILGVDAEKVEHSSDHVVPAYSNERNFDVSGGRYLP
jgi:hypothetical protein